ncbi:hypothetical protein [Brevibacterium oceani]|uniref:hypothetical protein n=1 Tax=Brevibacterium oceani TaxID=358099 RepID=UPI001C62B2F4|nr:hypothetical protein [Brevibacterium oceani]
MISQPALAIVRNTLPAVGAAIGDITPIVYKRMFTARPELLRDLFNRGNQAQGEQQKALAGAIRTGRLVNRRMRAEVAQPRRASAVSCPGEGMH